MISSLDQWTNIFIQLQFNLLLFDSNSVKYAHFPSFFSNYSSLSYSFHFFLSWWKINRSFPEQSGAWLVFFIFYWVCPSLLVFLPVDSNSNCDTQKGPAYLSFMSIIISPTLQNSFSRDTKPMKMVKFTAQCFPPFFPHSIFRIYICPLVFIYYNGKKISWHTTLKKIMKYNHF